MRKLATFAAAFSAAVFAWRYGLWPLALGAGLLCLAGLLLARRKQEEGKAARLRLGLLLGGLAAALLWCGLFSALTMAPWEGRHKEKDVVLTARIDGWPAPNDRGQMVADARLTDPDTGRSVDGLVYLPGDTEVRPGDGLTLRGTLYLADRVSGGEITYFSSQGVFLRFYVEEVAALERPETPFFRCWPILASARVKEDLYGIFDETTAPLAAALVLGDKTGLTGNFLAMSRRAGLAHVIVISGMHVSFLAGLMAVFLGRRRRSSVLLTLFLLIFFALMAGGTPSAWRAVLLCGAGLIAPLVGRENDPPTSLLTALMLLLVVNPYSAASISLQLSFAAVAGIELLVPGLLKKWTPKRRTGEHWLRGLWRRFRAALAAGLAVSLGAILFTTPLTALYFGAVSLIGPVSNLLTLWAVSDAFLLSVLAVVVRFFLPAAAVVIALPGVWLLKYLLWLVPLLGNLPFASVTMTSFYYAFGLAVLYGLVCLNLFWSGKKRLRVPVLCCAALVMACVAFTRMEYVLGDMTVAVLDVGQGLSVCIQSGGRTILVDCGGDGYNDAGDVAADYLADQGIGTLDLLVLTHYHTDHANGVPELLERLEVKAMALPDVDREDPLRQAILAQAAEEGAEVTYITENTVWPLGEEGELTLYAPLGDGGTNERGLAVLASSGDYDALITGDMNSQVEGRLVKYGDLPDIELLVAGHHGSRASTGDCLLDETRPKQAVISVGEGNSYGHPAQETLERLADRDIAIYRTDLSGTVVIHTKGR